MPMHQDIHVAARRLLIRPAHTLLTLAIVALGIGSATAVFSVVDQTVLRAAPFPHADRLVDVLDINRNTGGGGSSFTPQKVVAWQTQSSFFERFEAYSYQQMDVTGSGEPERISGLQVSLGLFSMLDAHPRIGRSFEPGDGGLGSERVVVIGDALWRKRFGGSADVVGQRILLNGVPYTVIGVMPRKFRLLDKDESFWLPVDMQARITDRTLRGFYGIGLLAPGVAQDRAQQVADALADRLQPQSPLPSTWGLRVTQKKIARVDDTTRTALLVLLGAVSFVLLISCANVASLFLSQAPARQREMAIRSALGASRGRLIRSVLAESLLLAALGGFFGVLLAGWGVGAVLAAAPDRMLWMSTTPIELDGRILAVAGVLTLVTGFIFGIFPAWRGSRPNLETTLRGSTAGAGGGSYGRLPGGLVVVEVAFAVVLMVGATLMARTLANLNAIEPGFDPNGVIVMHIALPSDRYPTPAACIQFFDALRDRLRGVAGISAVAASQGTPPAIGALSFGRPEIEGRGIPDTKVVTIPNGTVSPEYFRALGMPIIAGRGFTTNDASDVVIVSQAFAEKYWAGANAVGGRFRMFANSRWRTVIGVVSNVQASGDGDSPTALQFYSPWVAPAAQAAPQPPAPSGALSRSYDYRKLIVRAENPSAAIPLIKRQIWAIDPNQPVERVALAADTYAALFGKQRFVMRLMMAFAVLALALTAAGIFGVLSQAVAQRTREIGIRMALGARPMNVVALVVSRGILLASAGVVFGAVAALILVTTLGALLYGIGPRDPSSFAVVAALLLVVALVASWLPARAAMKIQPALVLRRE